MALSDNEANYDGVCAMCDNGGIILCCEGSCLRCFHATVDAGADTNCKSLGLSNVEIKTLRDFVCNNCQFNLHQCFACGVLGSSDISWGAEVFPCSCETCGYFYHPKCAARLLHPENKAEVEECERKISAGGSFTCPVHKCHICKKGENKKDDDLRFAVCRRCPKSYHRKCLPREIAFYDWSRGSNEGITIRAWDGLLQNDRILMYCLDHEIDKTLGGPTRNHIILL